jgi:hypothetical protein
MKNLLRAGAALALVLITMFATLAFRPSAQTYEYNTALFYAKNCELGDGRPNIQYKTGDTKDRKRIMDILGAEGWELVGITDGLWCFKRPKQ